MYLKSELAMFIAARDNVYLNANLNSADILTVKHFAFK